MSSLFNPQGGTMKIFVEGLGEVEVSTGGLDEEWQRKLGLLDPLDEDEPPFAREQKCPHCGQAIA